MYTDSVNEGPICTILVGSCACCVSPTVKRVLACNNREGDIPGGSEVDRLSPDADIASCRRGISRSISVRRFLISLITLFNASWPVSLVFGFSDKSWLCSSTTAAPSTRRPREMICWWRDFARGSADSRKTFPRPDLICQPFSSLLMNAMIRVDSTT